MTDEERRVERHAKRLCAEMGVGFLSCEYHARITERPLWIAVEDESGCYEIKRPYP